MVKAENAIDAGGVTSLREIKNDYPKIRGLRSSRLQERRSIMTSCIVSSSRGGLLRLQGTMISVRIVPVYDDFG